MIKAILFDLDETLVDRETTIEFFLQSQYTRLNLSNPPYEVYQERFKRLDERGYADRRKVFQTLREDFAIQLSVDELVADFRQNAWQQCQTFLDAHLVLEQLRLRGYQLGIITNGSSESQWAKLKGASLISHFDVILISEEEKVKKPAPEIFLRAAGKLNANPQACVFVGDNPEVDIIGAFQVGMQTVWRKGHLPWPDRLSITPKYTIGVLSELLAVSF